MFEYYIIISEVIKMLMQFNFENHRTYLNEVSLDLSATSIKEHEDNCFMLKNDEKYLKVVAIYGANGSGKTNVLDAFHFMQFFVKSSFKNATNDKKLPDERFAFCNSGKSKPAMYEVFISSNGFEYQYGFNFNGKEFTKEWLLKRDFRGKSKYNIIFTRNNKKFNLSEKLLHLSETLKIVTDKSLAISFLSGFKIVDVKNVTEWFDETKVLRYGNSGFESAVSNIIPDVDFNDENQKRSFIDFLKAIDSGIEDVKLEKTTNEASKKSLFNFLTIRQNCDTGEQVEMGFEEESSGTLKTISMYGSIKDALVKGRTLFIDELDAKLHPLLTKYIINLFQNEESNLNNGQLVFTTHNTEILKKDIFRRDQIWFSEKNIKGESELYSLVEFVREDGKKVRNDASYDKDYLSGRYGAIPQLIDIEFSDNNE